MADRRSVMLAATLLTLVMVLSSMGLLAGAAGARSAGLARDGAPAGPNVAGVLPPSAPSSFLSTHSPTLFSSMIHPAAPTALSSAAELGVNPAVASAERMIRDHQINPSSVFLPADNQANALAHPGLLSSLYSLGTPSPMGLADLGLGASGAYVYNSSSFESSIKLSSFTDYNPGYASFDAPPNYMTWQLNTVTVNTSYPGSTTGSFWIQNVVHFNGSTLQFENNIWNFSSPTQGLNPGTLLSYSGNLVPGVFYYVFGPTFTVTYPFTLNLFNNVTTQGGHPGVYFNYTLTNTTTGSHSGSFDYVTFNGPVVPSAPPMFEVNGKNYNPLGFLLWDAELIFGGNGGGANAIITALNGSATLNFWNKSSGAYQSVRSAYNYGVDTGETADGVATTYLGTTENLRQGPSFLNGLWNTSNTSWGPHAVPGWINVDLTGLPSYGFAFASNQSALSYLRGVTGNFSYAPSLVTGETVTQLPPPPVGDGYVFRGYANGYGQYNITVSDNTSGTASFFMVTNSRSFDTPVYLSSDAQAAAFGASGVAGVTYSAAAHTLWINNTQAFVGKPFYQINDFRFPNFLLFAADNLTVNVSLNHFIQDPLSFLYYKYNSPRPPPPYYAYLSQGYYFNYGTGKFSVTNTSVIGSNALVYAAGAIPLPAVEFWQTNGSRAGWITTAGDSFGVDVLNSTDATLWNISGQSGANAIAVVGSSHVAATFISSNSTDFIVLPAPFGPSGGIPTWGAYINTSSFVSIDHLTASNGSIWVYATGNAFLDIENVSAVNSNDLYGFGLPVTFGTLPSQLLAQFLGGVGLVLKNVQAVNSTGPLNITADVDNFTGVSVTNFTQTGGGLLGVGLTIGLLFGGYGTVSSSVSLDGVSAGYGSVGALPEFVTNLAIQNVRAVHLATGVLVSGGFTAPSLNVTEANVTASDDSVGVVNQFVIGLQVRNVWSGSESLGVLAQIILNASITGVNGTAASLGAPYFANPLFTGLAPNAAVLTGGVQNAAISNVSALNYGWAVQDNNSTSLTIQHVTAWNGGTGVALGGTISATLAALFLYGNTWGATFLGTQNTTLTGSTFEGSSSFGVSVTGATTFSAYGNNFIANNGASTAGVYSASHIQASVSGGSGVSFNLGSIGNYWSDWAGPGAYVINGGLSDSAPFFAVLSTWLEFNETGLPVALAWGFTLDTVPYTTSAPLIFIPSWSLASATLGFVVNPPVGWAPTPASGSVAYTGANQTVTISFVRAHYTVDFLATGLPSGTLWSVTFNGTTLQDTTSGASGTISYSVLSGTYPYTVGTVANYNAVPSNGTVVVTGSNLNVSITFTHVPVQYPVTFTEAGLPSGTPWSVTLGAGVVTSATPTVTFSELNGTYSYTVGAVAGYTPTPAAGTITVSGVAQNVNINWSLTPPTTYPLTFMEAGLPSGTNWSVTLGTTTQFSVTTTIVFEVPNGTYAYTIPVTLGYAPGTASGTVNETGSAQTVSVSFAAVPPVKYTVTFTETGLPSGTNWSVTLAGSTETSNTSTITFQEVNGTYAYTIGTVTGYTFTPSSGSVDVLGASPAVVSVAFSPGSSPSSPAGGLSNLDWLIIGIVVALIVIALIVLLARRGGRTGPTAATTTTTSTETTPEGTTTTESAAWSEDTPPPPETS